MIRLTAVIEVEGQAPRALTHESNARLIVIGRDAAADFQLPLSTVSRRHARISEVDSVYFIEDLGSTHGVSVNGRRLATGEKKMLRNGDIVQLTQAKITCSIESEKVAVAEPGEGTQAVAVRAVQGILGRLGEAKGDGPFFRVVNGPDEGTRFSLMGGGVSEWTLGRSKDCEFVLNDPNVSRRHAIVKKDWNGFIIQDLGSRNGVLVNEKRIPRPKRLRDRDEVIIGPIKLLFVDPDADLLAALKDVPGFDMGDNSEVDAEPVDSAEANRQPTSAVPEAQNPGAVGPAAQGDLGPQVSAGNTALPPVGAPASVADGVVADAEAVIDPELLEAPTSRAPLEWLTIAGVGILIVFSVVLLFVILG